LTIDKNLSIIYSRIFGQKRILIKENKMTNKKAKPEIVPDDGIAELNALIARVREAQRNQNVVREVKAEVKPAEGAEEAKLTSKELRKQRAEERAKIAPKVNELKRRVEKAEKKIEELQASLDAASEELFNPKPTTDFAETNRLVRTLQFEIDRYTLEWEEAATELENLTK
jgi:predicted RNase H-like nuclease (RuvC/YqgF family)